MTRVGPQRHRKQKTNKILPASVSLSHAFYISSNLVCIELILSLRLLKGLLHDCFDVNIRQDTPKRRKIFIQRHCVSFFSSTADRTSNDA